FPAAAPPPDSPPRRAPPSRDVPACEQAELEKIGMPAEIVMRHRPTQFCDIPSGDHYASGYYSYMWSEVMDADAFGAFEEAGDIFDPATAKRARRHLFERWLGRSGSCLCRLPRPGARGGRAAAAAWPAGDAGSGL